MLEVGEKVRDFELINSFNQHVRLSDYNGKIVVIFFYSKVGTNGCNKEILSYQELYSKYAYNNIIVLGISKDNVKSLYHFVQKHQIQYQLLSDEQHIVLNYFGVYGEKNMYGKKVMGTNRSTFVLNQNHEIIKVFKKAVAAKNAQDVLQWLSNNNYV